MKRNEYKEPLTSIVELQSQSQMLVGSPGNENAGAENYIEQPGLSW